MKKLFFLACVLFSLLSVFNSCSDSELNKELVNPLDEIGIEHNKFMAKFTEELEKSYKLKKWDGIEFLSDDYINGFTSLTDTSFRNLYENSESTILIQKELYNKLEINSWFKKDENTILDLAKSALNNEVYLTRSTDGTTESKISEKDKEFTTNLLIDIASVVKKEYDSDKEAYDALREVINTHEKLILSQNWLPEETSALGTLAIAKYSAVFWENYDFSIYEKHKASASTRGWSDFSKRKKRGCTVVLADAAGYVVGGVVGGVGGSFLGPAGTLGGVFGGKAIGAWTGSAAAATAFAIYDAWCDALS